MDTELVRSVARELRYRPLDHLVGRVVEVTDLGRVEEAVRRAFGSDLPEGSHLTPKTYCQAVCQLPRPKQQGSKGRRRGLRGMRCPGFLPNEFLTIKCGKAWESRLQAVFAATA